MTPQYLLKAFKAAEDALSTCYDITEYPADGSTAQDAALEKVRRAIKYVERAQKEASAVRNPPPCSLPKAECHEEFCPVHGRDIR